MRVTNIAWGIKMVTSETVLDQATVKEDPLVGLISPPNQRPDPRKILLSAYWIP
jgi:hypothetical protein